jgi:uncharacterized protein YceK
MNVDFGLDWANLVAILRSILKFREVFAMTLRAMPVAWLLSVLSLAGCGTASSLVCVPPEEGGKAPFGGVRQDLTCIKKAANGEVGIGTHSKSDSDLAQVAPILLGAADLPFSFVGDVLVWPYTASYSYINQPIPTPPVRLASAPGASSTSPGNRTAPGPVESLPQPRVLP